jgi:hypothetical protein
MSAAFRLRPEDPIRRVMDSPRLSAGGLRLLDLHVPTVDLGRPSEDRRAYWTEIQTTMGLPRFAPLRHDRGGCFLYSGVLVSEHEIERVSCQTRAKPLFL